MDVTLVFKSKESANIIFEEFKKIIPDAYLSFVDDYLAISWVVDNPSTLRYFIMMPGETITIQENGNFYFNGDKDA